MNDFDGRPPRRFQLGDEVFSAWDRVRGKVSACEWSTTFGQYTYRIEREDRHPIFICESALRPVPPLAVHSRVELHPGCNMWIRGARFGTIVRVWSKHGEPRVTVRLDANGRRAVMSPDRVSQVLPGYNEN